MPDTTPLGGRTVARYRILEEVGRGGMATVYRALDPALGREVAVKVLHPHLAGESEARLRLEREAQAVAKLRHDNILEIYDFSDHASPESAESFLVTEFIRGPTLTVFLGQHPVGLPEVAGLIVQQLAAALETAHRSGVIHRDIKPENVMIRAEDGRIKLTDFGIAQVIDKERLTATGQLIGSPAYLAPELVEGGRVDFRTDVFSLGIVLYRLATGQLPFSGRNPHEMMKRIVEGRYPPPDQVNPLVGRGLARILGRALARKPDDRYPTMELLRQDLEADLAAAGIEDVRGELSRYFRDPAGWEAAARPRFTTALLESARRELAGGRSAAALALLGRALALSPGDAAARALFERLGRKRRVGKAAIGAGAALAVAAAAVLVARQPPVRPAPPLGMAALVASAAPPVGAAPPVRDALPEATSLPPRSGEPAALRAGPAPAPRGVAPAARPEAHLRPLVTRVRPPAAPATRAVRFNVLPKNVEVLVDGAPIPGRYWRPGDPIDVGAGPHELTFQNPSCWPETIHLAADATAIPGTVRLRWMAGRLLVKTVPENAEVKIELEHGGQKTIRGGEPVVIRIPPELEAPREQVKVSAGVGEPVRAVVQANQLTVVDLTRPPR